MIAYGICLCLSDLLCLVCSRSIHVAANGIISFFLWLSNIPLYMCIHTHTHTHTHTHNFYFINSSIVAHLGFHVLAVVNSAAMDIGISVSFWIIVLSGYMHRSGITGSHGNSEEPPYCFPSWLHQFIFLPTVCRCSLFSTTWRSKVFFGASYPLPA